MKRSSETTTDQQMEVLCGRVAEWRKHRSGGRSMVPEALWNAAVEVARVEGVHATSKAVRFNYYSLKDRLVRADRADRADRVSKAAATRSKPKKADVLATFVEVKMPSPPRTSLTTRVSEAVGQTVVELVGTAGARMRIDVTGASNVDVVGLVHAFWGRAS